MKARRGCFIYVCVCAHAHEVMQRMTFHSWLVLETFKPLSCLLSEPRQHPSRVEYIYYLSLEILVLAGHGSIRPKQRVSEFRTSLI